ncbi:MAG: Na+/H+ antiporter NhaC family protein [Myxococcales bacterium]
MGVGEPTWLALVPPLLAIGGALAFKRVVPALALGVLVGASLLHGFGAGLARFFDRYLWNALIDSGHLWILGLALCLGGMIRVIGQTEIAGSMAGGITRYATNRRRGQLTAWMLGLVFFFDDYVNTLFVGSTMGSVSERLRISRAKLAFTVDATAAPVASLAPVSTWIATEIAYIGDQCRAIGLQTDPFGIFLQTLPGRFYSWLMLAFVLMVAVTGRDFGPMLRAERAAVAGHADGSSSAAPPPVVFGRLLAWAPILVVLVVVTGGVILTGYLGAAASGEPVTATAVLDNAESSRVMVMGAFLGGVTAVLIAASLPHRPLRDSALMWGRGTVSMVHVMSILLLAWALGDVCRDMQTARYLVSKLGAGFEPGLLPAIVFLVSGVTSFATGTSWGTMGILFPLAMPMAHELSPGDQAVMLGTISSILAGSVFGDHCSPISDTTIMSSMAAGCDHLAHVRTQLPYALLVGVVSLLFGAIPAGLGLWPTWVGLALGVGALWIALRTVGRPVSGDEGATSAAAP